MLRYLKLKNVGPSHFMEMDLGDRINVITGDNGMGKSFLLNVAWWALTQTWARQLVVPHPAPAKASIASRVANGTPTPIKYINKFNRKTDTWSVIRAQLPNSSLVLYAQSNSGFSVWDPVRNYRSKGSPPAYLFDPSEVWEGNSLCEGLIRDWGAWQRENSAAFQMLRSVLKVLSPSKDKVLEPVDLRKITLDDPKRYPTLRMPYGQDVAVIHVSAGMRRIIALAYLLVWAWIEHVDSSKLLAFTPVREIVFLIDDIEAHLQLDWQKRIIPALLDVMRSLTGLDIHVQVIATTHSQAVLDSIKPHFDKSQDRVFLLDLVDGEVEISTQRLR